MRRRCLTACDHRGAGEINSDDEAGHGGNHKNVGQVVPPRRRYAGVAVMQLREVRQNEDRSRAHGSDTERQQRISYRRGYDRLDGGCRGSIPNERQQRDGQIDLTECIRTKLSRNEALE